MRLDQLADNFNVETFEEGTDFGVRILEVLKSWESTDIDPAIFICYLLMLFWLL